MAHTPNMEIRTQVEQHIEVHKFRPGVVAGVAVLALVLQAFIPAHVPRVGDYMELPLLVTIYFGLSRRNPSTGLLLGMGIGIVQDSLSSGHLPIGVYGIAKTLVGFFASSIGARIDTENPIGRFLQTFLFFLFHHAAYVTTQRVLLAHRESYFTLTLLFASLINAALAVLIFPLLDKLRKT
jgi:rod shape-determining protein MreD